MCCSIECLQFCHPSYLPALQELQTNFDLRSSPAYCLNIFQAHYLPWTIRNKLPNNWLQTTQNSHMRRCLACRDWQQDHLQKALNYDAAQFARWLCMLSALLQLCVFESSHEDILCIWTNVMSPETKLEDVSRPDSSQGCLQQSMKAQTIWTARVWHANNLWHSRSASIASLIALIFAWTHRVQLSACKK